ncbi:hypothetical protein CEXT_365561 [Caerostris extrusa]|uniref:Uncharacterized protein n=1 Tax=Caerostris extrusa TaxID=172846 RepID=A0AAV4UYK4_CAEEX|nr:hypothetical protein CEXT_365561 [Caerostris extrusa]
MFLLEKNDTSLIVKRIVDIVYKNPKPHELLRKYHKSHYHLMSEECFVQNFPISPGGTFPPANSSRQESLTMVKGIRFPFGRKLSNRFIDTACLPCNSKVNTQPNSASGN